MTADDLIINSLSRKGLSTAMDIFDYYEKKEINDVISKQTYLKQRKKLNYKVFTHLNQSYLKNFYGYTTQNELFNGYLVMAIDGSKAEVLASDENIKQFGERTLEKGTIRAFASCITDVINKFTLDIHKKLSNSINNIFYRFKQVIMSNIMPNIFPKMVDRIQTRTIRQKKLKSNIFKGLGMFFYCIDMMIFHIIKQKNYFLLSITF